MVLLFSRCCIFTLLLIIGLTLNFTRSYSQIFSSSLPSSYQSVFTKTDAFDSSYLTTLEKVIRKPLPDTLALLIGNDLAYYWHTRDLDKALTYARKFYLQSLTTHDLIWQGRLQTTLGAILLRQDKLDTAMSVLISAQAKLPKKEWPHLLTQMGYVMERRGLLDKAADFAQHALRISDSLQVVRGQAMAYSDLSNLFWKQAKYQKGIEYGLRSETLYNQRGISDLDYSFTLYVIGINYLSSSDYERALAYFNQALVMSMRYQFYNNLADIYISLCELYKKTKDFDQAEKSAQNAIRYSALLKNNFMLMRSWLELGKLQNLTNQNDIAIASLEKSLQVATGKFRDNYFLHIVYKELGNAYSQTGNYKKATEAFLKYDELKDSVFTAEADERIAKLQTEFEVAQKENTIKSQGQLISQQSRIQILFAIGAALLALLLLILYRNYRGKQKINNQLNALNESLGQKNLQLDRRNAENELLLKEIHHRVKNNLEIVSGLLSLQAAKMDSPSAQAVMQSSQNRVMSMGIIHQKLYQKDNLAAIEMRDYFQNLGESILDSFNEAHRIRIQCDMNPLELDVDTAVPIGLIANELVTNALKYAFPKDKVGEIQIRLVKTNIADELLFQVKDNGIGKQNNGSAKGTGFGTELVHLLVQQLNGNLSIEVQDGTAINIHFNYTKR